ILTSIDLETVIDNFETLTTIVDNGNGTFTYTDEDNVTTTIDISNLETLTSIALNTDNTHIDYIDEDGATTQLDLTDIVKNLESLTVLAYNDSTNTLTYTDETGIPYNLNLNEGTVAYNAVTNVITYTDAAGNATTLTLNATDLSYNTTTQNLVYVNSLGVTQTIDLGNLVNSVIDAKDLTAADASITVTDGTGATLVDSNIKVADGGISTIKLADNAVNSAKIIDGEVKTDDLANTNVTAVKLNNDVAGVGLVKNSTTNALDVNANNGLNVDSTADAVQLGGNLIKPTTVITDATNTLALAGLQPGTTSDKLVVAESDGTLRQVNAAMPKFFYMPPIIFDTSVNGTFTKNLHTEYLGQFSGTSNPTLVRSTAAPSEIPNVPGPTDLYYYITYYDTNVFSNVSINANGVLTYNIINNATAASFMTIVFVVK
ncbi:hypothetical protein, partial [Aequorivita flava]